MNDVIKKSVNMEALAEKTGLTVNYLYIIKGRTRPCSGAAAKKLEEVTGIDRAKWVWPDEFGDPWVELLK